MCGIAGFHRLGDTRIEKLDKLATNLLLAIENRGRDAAGYVAVMDSGKVQLEKTVGCASTFTKKRGRINESARSVLLHTRFKTTGTKDAMDAHPHASGSIAAVHNGTVYNADEIFRVFDLPRRATVDSEVIPALVHYAGWNQTEHALGLLNGGAAVAMVNTEKPDEMILACIRYFPLCYAEVGGIVIFASTEKAIRGAWRKTYKTELPAKVVHMEQGDIVRVNGTVEAGRIPGIDRAPAKKPYTPSQKGRARGAQNFVERTASQAHIPMRKGEARRRRKAADRARRTETRRARSRTSTTYTVAQIDALLDDLGYTEQQCTECGAWEHPDELVGGICDFCVQHLPLWDRDYLNWNTPSERAWEALQN